MVAINFSPQFAGRVESGMKTQTIRRTARCKPGDDLQLYMGQRTKACRKLRDAVCVSITPIRLDACAVELAGHVLPADSALWFAMADGFMNLDEMRKWFESRYGELPFHGVVIRWDLKP